MYTYSRPAAITFYSADAVYLDLVKQVLSNGEERTDRTGVGTLSVFGAQATYDLTQGFPLLTTKKVNFDAVVHELLWFLRGETNIDRLPTPQLWQPWADEAGNLGPIYGSQFRSWGGRGVDQIKQAVDLIHRDPSSRRICVSAWNAEDLPRMALPPCHAFFQFYVRNDTYLDCHLYQRSGDLAVGVPFNIASYALLTHLIAKETVLLPGRFIHSFGDLHIYKNHVEGLAQQMRRTPYPSPRLDLPLKRLDDFTFDDIRLSGYKHHPFIRFEVAV